MYNCVLAMSKTTLLVIQDNQYDGGHTGFTFKAGNICILEDYDLLRDIKEICTSTETPYKTGKFYFLNRH